MYIIFSRVTIAENIKISKKKIKSAGLMITNNVTNAFVTSRVRVEEGEKKINKK